MGFVKSSRGEGMIIVIIILIHGENQRAKKVHRSYKSKIGNIASGNEDHRYQESETHRSVRCGSCIKEDVVINDPFNFATINVTLTNNSTCY